MALACLLAVCLSKSHRRHPLSSSFDHLSCTLLLAHCFKLLIYCLRRRHMPGRCLGALWYSLLHPALAESFFLLIEPICYDCTDANQNKQSSRNTPTV